MSEINKVNFEDSHDEDSLKESSGIQYSSKQSDENDNTNLNLNDDDEVEKLVKR